MSRAKRKRQELKNSKKQPLVKVPAGVDTAGAVQISNSLSSLAEGLGYNGFFGGSQLSQTDTFFKNNRWYMISNMRQLLSQMYVEHGIIQTLVDQPVDDAFRGGIIIDSDELDEDDIQTLQEECEKEGIMQVIAQAFKWNRLYGGAGVMIISNQACHTTLKEFEEGEPVEFRSVDMWELFYNKQNVAGSYEDIKPYVEDEETEFNYYSERVNSTRVMSLKGKEAPSFIRPRLRGWGMSEVERLIRSFNQYLKNNDVIFELLDEAKIDVYKINGFASAMASSVGTAQTQQRIQLSNQMKNTLNALVMDSEDDYEQKTLAFSGLGEMLNQVRQGIASDVKMPITKLFGVSSSGFNSGEDDIENYNSMIDGEVRAKAKPIIINILKIKCQTLFGMTPEDLSIEFPPLRVLSAEQEENVKDKKYNRYSGMYSQGLLSAKEYSELLKKEDLLPLETEVMKGTRDAEVPEPPASFDQPQKMTTTTQES